MSCVVKMQSTLGMSGDITAARERSGRLLIGLLLGEANAWMLSWRETGRTSSDAVTCQNPD